MARKQKALLTTKRERRHHRYWNVTRDFRGRYVKWTKWRPEPKMYRLTLAINYVLHDKYYSFKVQAWHRDKKTLNRRSEPLKKELTQKLEKKLGYKEDDFWFDARIGKEKPEKVPFDSSLVGTEEFSDEFLRKKKK